MVRTRYSSLDKLNLFLGAYGRLFDGIFRPHWWLPFFVFSIFQAAGLAVLTWYYAPLWVGIVKPVLAWFIPPPAFHYPQYYLALPSVYSAYENFVLGPIIWVIILGAAVYRLGGIYAGRRFSVKEAIGVASGRFFPMLLVWILETVLVLVVLSIPSLFLDRILAGSPNRALAASLLAQMVGFAVSALLIYAVPGIIIDGKKVIAAIGDSMSLFFGSIFLTFFIVFVPSVIRLAMNFLLTDFAPRIITLLNPDLIPALLLLDIVLGVFINLFIYGAAVFVYVRLNE
jgi:hypothetical protein